MSGGKTKTTSTEKVTLPAWMSQGGQSNFNNAQAWSAANPVTPYSGQLSVGPNGNQTMASRVAAATGVGAGDLDAARMYADQSVAGGAPMQADGQQVTAGQVGTTMWDGNAAQRYMSPYLATVQGNTLDAMRRTAAQDQAGLADQVQASGAYGGARGTLAATELNRNQADARTNYVDQSTQDAYNAAMGQFNADRGAQIGVDTGNRDATLGADTFNSGQAADIGGRNLASKNSLMDRLLAASSARSAIGGQAQDFTSNDITNLLKTGATQENTTQAALDRAYADYNLNQNSGIQRYKDLASILGITPTDKTVNSTGTTQQSPGLLNTLLAGGQLAASAFGASDRRLKAKITPLGITTADGLAMYAWRYIGTGEISLGVMADDVASLRPDALGPTIAGFATVDYGSLAG